MLVQVLHVTRELCGSSELKNRGSRGTGKGQRRGGLRTEQVVTVSWLSDGWGDTWCKLRHSRHGLEDGLHNKSLFALKEEYVHANNVSLLSWLPFSQCLFSMPPHASPVCSSQKQSAGYSRLSCLTFPRTADTPTLSFPVDDFWRQENRIFVCCLWLSDRLSV